ncbi:hypothetical protein H9P43_005232 [Blastocladiella emersonii ATCC 22665]|nr:hypothetical protein H9P43_005232 [Blastocladiella emersonii ATCC 22665]
MKFKFSGHYVESGLRCPIKCLKKHKSSHIIIGSDGHRKVSERKVSKLAALGAAIGTGMTAWTALNFGAGINKVLADGVITSAETASVGETLLKLVGDFVPGLGTVNHIYNAGQVLGGEGANGVMDYVGENVGEVDGDLVKTIGNAVLGFFSNFLELERCFAK